MQKEGCSWGQSFILHKIKTKDLTLHCSLSLLTTMNEKLMMNLRQPVSENAFAAIKIWQVPQPVRASQHLLKYSLVLVRNGVCLLRYDNEAGKGDHKHIGQYEVSYKFYDAAKLLEDFWADVDMILKEQL
jgi:hypothetical protein